MNIKKSIIVAVAGICLYAGTPCPERAGKVRVVSASGKGKYSAGKTTDKVALDKFSAVIFKIGD